MSALFFAKILVSAVVIAVATEIAKRDTFWGALLIAMPLTSILALTWLYVDTRDNALTTRFAREVLLLVPVSLVFFVPFLLEPRTRFGFWPNLGMGLGLLAVGVLVMRQMTSGR